MRGVQNLGEIAQLALLVEDFVRVAKRLPVRPVLRLYFQTLTELFDEAEELLARVLSLVRI